LLVKELRRYIQLLPGNADVVIQKRITNKWTLVSPVLHARITKTKDLKKDRLVLMNMKLAKKSTITN